MSNDSVIVCQRMSDKPVVSDLKKCGDSAGFIALSVYPIADRIKSTCYGIVWSKKKAITAISGPLRQLISAPMQFICNLFNTGNPAGLVLLDQPVPECRTEIETIMQVLGLDQNICIK